MNNLPVNNPNSNLSIILQERLRQSRYSFNLALTTTAISFCISLVGFGLILSDKVSSGTISFAVGLVSSVRCLKFAKDANDRLDQILRELEHED